MRNAQKTKRFLKIINFCSAFTAFQKTSKTDEILKKLESETDETDFRRIRCPLCRWQPDSASRWFCADCDFPEYFYGGCWTSWNTFETKGKCPGCGHCWRWTSCLRCGGWAKHEDWYENDKN
jgi:hypothetical protein